MAAAAGAAVATKAVDPATFSRLGVADWLVKAAAAMAIRAPTAVQEGCIPAILEGKDTYAVAKTGSGKTAAFAIPMLQRLAKDPFSVFGIILTPTRELAFQIAEQFGVLGAPINLRQVTVVGGLDMVSQGLELSRAPHLIVATPGRLADHLTSAANIRVARLQILVFDEADRLLQNPSFASDIETITAALPKSRQTLLFTATGLKSEAAAELKQSLRSPVFTFEAQSPTATVATLRQQYMLVPAHVRHCYFVNLLQSLVKESNSGSCIVFTSTCQSCAELALLLDELEMPCAPLHSQMSQSDRLASLGKFKSNYVQILVATDVASRGLDIAPVKVVLNFNVPKAVDDYIHRVGRTARAGRGGRAVTLMSEHDVKLIHAIESKVGIEMAAYEGLVEEDVLKSMSKINVARRAVNMRLLEMDFGVKKKKRKNRAASASTSTEPGRLSKQKRGRKSEA